MIPSDLTWAGLVLGGGDGESFVCVSRGEVGKELASRGLIAVNSAT